MREVCFWFSEITIHSQDSTITKHWMQYDPQPLDVTKSQTLDLYGILGAISSHNLQFHSSPAPCSVFPPLIGHLSEPHPPLRTLDFPPFGYKTRST